MSLRIIYGKSGSGKSQFCFSEIANLIDEKNKVFIITPEQFSFTAEKKLMDSIESGAVINAEVVTLTRMAYRVLNEIGGTTKTHLSKCGKSMLIYFILNNQSNELKFLGKSDENIELGMNLITELKKHGVTVDSLKDEVEKVDDKYLKTKLKDITLIYEKFEEQITDKYIEETDLLTILANNLEKTDIVTNSIIYIDEFSGFTKQEYEVLKVLMKKAKQVNITMCVDNIDLNTNPDTDIFYSNKVTLIKIIDFAKKNRSRIRENSYT